MNRIRTVILVVIIQIFATPLCAQSDGAIIEKVRLDNLESLISYIEDTESRERDSILLDQARFDYFEKVNVFGIAYWSDGLRVRGFLLQPKKSGVYPAIIYNRGGSLDFGSLTDSHASIGLGELARLANHGFVIAASQYRGNGGGEGQEEYGGADINDVLNLIPILENEPMADAQRLGMFGWSRGAMTTFLTMKRTNKIKAVAVGGPSTNLVRGIIDRSELDEWWSQFIPDYSTNKKEILEKRSANMWVDELPKNVPILMLQGAEDLALPSDYTLEFALELTKHSVPYRLIKYERGSHSLKEYRSEVFRELFTWFDRYLINEEVNNFVKSSNDN